MSLLVARLACAALAAQAIVVFAPVQAWAAVPVEESVEAGQTEPRTQPRSQPQVERQSLGIPPTIEPQTPSEQDQRPISVAPVRTQPATGGSGQLSDLFYQLQVLQQELQDLRGQVEEQSYLISRMQRDQKEQYLDLDRRVSAVSENRPAPGPSASPVTTPGPVEGGGQVLNERDAYTAAFEAMRARQFETSMQGFQALIQNYPNGQYTANAYYWIGELHLVANADAEQARQSFMQVVNLYPDHQKTPDAMYKLGVVYHNLGDVDTALDFLARTQREFPNTSAAGLAAKYAAELQ